MRWLAAVAGSEEGAAGGLVGLVRWGVGVVVALEGVTPGCPRVGTHYWRCPSPTSTWGAAIWRHAAAPIILTPLVSRRPIALDTFLIHPSSFFFFLFFFPLSLFLSLFHVYLLCIDIHIYIYSPPLLPSPSTQPPPTTTSTITTYHYNRHAPPSRVITSQGKRAMFVMSTNIYIAIARSPSLTLEWVLQCFTSGCTWCSVCALPHRGPCGLVCTYHSCS